MTNIKQWFEENFLDGDLVQDGQTLSSKECLDALTQQEELHRKELESILEEVSNVPIPQSDEVIVAYRNIILFIINNKLK